MPVIKSYKELMQSKSLQMLQKIIKDSPKIASFAVRRCSLEAIQRAKTILLYDHPDWDPLWEKAQSPGKWTPEFNWSPKTETGFRKQNHNSSQPLLDTGALYDSIKIMGTTRTKYSAAVDTIGSELPYAAMMEYGGQNPLFDRAGNRLNDIPARPYLYPAISSVQNDRSFLMKLKNEIVRDLKKVKGGK